MGYGPNWRWGEFAKEGVRARKDKCNPLRVKNYRAI